MVNSEKDIEAGSGQLGLKKGNDPSDHTVVSDEPVVEKATDAEAEQIVDTNLTKHSGIDPPPNGGFLAWMQVAGSFFLFFNCW